MYPVVGKSGDFKKFSRDSARRGRLGGSAILEQSGLLSLPVYQGEGVTLIKALCFTKLLYTYPYFGLFSSFFIHIFKYICDGLRKRCTLP